MALSKKDASIVLGMLARGDKNQDIAAWFGENPARIDEVQKGEYGAVAASAAELPPKGAVGLKAKKLRAYATEALQALQAGDTAFAIRELEQGLAQFDKDEA
jgi:hypothetical protein